MNSPEQLLSEQGFYAAAVHGQSMEPLLFNHRDTVYIEPLSVLHKRDVVLFRRSDGQLVLHRVLRCGKGGVLVCGDNDFRPETILPSQILGVMTAFTRNGRMIATTACGYRLYSAVWTLSLPTKKLLRWIYQWGRRS